MDRLDKETVMVDIETGLEKAEFIATNIIEKYGLDVTNRDHLDDLIFAGNRDNIRIEMEILSDYIQDIKKKISMLEEAYE